MEAHEVQIGVIGIKGHVHLCYRKGHKHKCLQLLMETNQHLGLDCMFCLIDQPLAVVNKLNFCFILKFFIL